MTGALLVLVMGFSLAFVPVVLFPVLRRIDEVLAIGYLVIRGAVETDCYVLSAIALLLLLPLAVREMVLAVWMIARGFRPAAVPAPSELRAAPQASF